VNVGTFDVESGSPEPTKEVTMRGYHPPVHVSVAAVGHAPYFRAVDARGREVGLFSGLGDLVRTVDLDDIVAD
jgi:hypothetical protein